MNTKEKLFSDNKAIADDDSVVFVALLSSLHYHGSSHHWENQHLNDSIDGELVLACLA